MADDVFDDDRRRVVGAGVRTGRDSMVASLRAVADVGITDIAPTVIATRGERLALRRERFSGGDQLREVFYAEVLGIVEINGDDRIVARVGFDPDDLDAAIEELDARYLAGEAAAHARTFSLIAGAFAAINRRELPKLTPDWVNIDHRRGIAFEPGDMTEFIRAIWDDTPDVNVYIEAVHGLSDLGAVVTQAATGTSQQGFAAEWRAINMSTVDGDLINRCELFDETDLDAALARFDELSLPAPRLENAASQVNERFWTYFEACDWAGMAEMLAAEISTDDRRRVVNAGVQHGRDAQIANVRILVEVGANITSTIMATRGQRLVLSRFRSMNRDLRHGEFDAEMLSIIEIDAENRISAGVLFDVDDIGAAFDELDARYLAAEAAEHSRTWSVIAKGYAALNRHELPPTTLDWVNVDRRRLATIEAGHLNEYLSAAWDVAPDMRRYIEAVHRLNNRGVVVTHVSYGTSHEGFDAEWRAINLFTVEGDAINRCELFDEADMDAALARFDELNRPPP
jgi:hypothetical protein